jgi:formiminotetrahydrofolate cyclodeaminase
LTDPDAGAGAAAASVVGLSASLIAAVARSSVDRWDEAGGAIAQAAALGRRAARLAAENAEVHGSAVAALAARSSERAGTEQEIADIRLGDALARAADLPLRIADAAADAAALAALVAERADPAVRPDAVGAGLLASAAADTAAHLVEVNLAMRPGDERITRAAELVSLARNASDRALAADG